MISVAEAAAMILARAPLPEPEHVPLAAALHRVLLEEIKADADSPRFDCSAMDGYALRRADATLPLRVVGEIPAGRHSEVTVGPGECVRIFTGGSIPAGADCVVMQEHVRLNEGRVSILGEIEDTHLRRRGENCRAGDLILCGGRRLQPAELAILAQCGAITPSVARRVRVVHFVSGDELVPPEQTPTGGQIRDCNSTLLAGLLASRGAQLLCQQHLLDKPASAQAALSKAPQDFDLLLISGGASVGDYDFTRATLEAAGFSLHFDKVNLRPGKPLLFATRGKQLAFGIPGNPVSHWVIFHLFLAPLLAVMSGCSAPLHRHGRLGADLVVPSTPRETWWPARVESDADYQLFPARFVSSGDIASLAGMNALLMIPPHGDHLSTSELLEFILCEL